MLFRSVTLNVIHPELTNHMAGTESSTGMSKCSRRDWLKAESDANDASVERIPRIVANWTIADVHVTRKVSAVFNHAKGE